MSSSVIDGCERGTCIGFMGVLTEAPFHDRFPALRRHRAARGSRGSPSAPRGPRRSRPSRFSTTATTLHVWFSGLNSGSTYTTWPINSCCSMGSSAPKTSGVTRTRWPADGPGVADVEVARHADGLGADHPEDRLVQRDRLPLAFVHGDNDSVVRADEFAQLEHRLDLAAGESGDVAAVPGPPRPPARRPSLRSCAFSSSSGR